MGNIKAFLQPLVTGETKEVVISKRFKDEDGKVVPFVIQVIDQDTNDSLIKRATKRTKVDGQIVKELDSEKYGRLLVAACTAEPDFKSTDMCAHYGVMDPLEVPGKMLSVGEYNRLVKEIRKLNELTEDYESLEEEVKN